MEPDEDDNLLVPAGLVRVVFGLLIMVGGVFIAALSEDAWGKYLGAAMFLGAPFILLKRPDSKDNDGI